jgi:Protein of unknown function (DUF2499)
MHALSLPTWFIHVSSVLEWCCAIWFIWLWAARQTSPEKITAWQGMAWGMLPSLVSALCACTWHLFDNAISLEWLVDLQAVMTLVGNCTLAWGGYGVWRAFKPVTNP